MVNMKRTINEIIIHCSDSNVKSHDNIDTIRKWHVEERGWKDIGYHFVITRDGHVHRGRPVEVAGAHCSGRNGCSIGVCLTGKDNFTEKQYIALEALCYGFMKGYGFDKSRINGHSAFNKAKSCPNFDVQELLNNPPF
jgi:N-acetyl-anhydromuramyl-L-alanine amidase AmpD